MTLPTTSTNSAALLRAKLTLLSPPMAAAFVPTLSRKERDVLDAGWPIFVHDHQQPPALAANGAPWVTWLIVGGRGVRPVATEAGRRIGLVAGGIKKIAPKIGG